MSNRTNGKIARAAEAAHKPVLKFLTEHIEEAGTIYGAAMNIGVHPNAVKHALKKLGYQVEVRQVAEVVRAEEARS